MTNSDAESIIQPFLRQYGTPVLYLSTANISAGYFNSIPGLNGCAVFDLGDRDIALSPCAPFLHMLSRCKPTETMITQSVYPPQQNAFRGYFETGRAYSRHDVIIPSELEYERKRMRESIISLLCTANTKIIVILNSQRLSAEAIEVIEEIERRRNNVKIILCFNAVEKIADSDTTGYYRSLRFNHNFHKLTAEVCSDLKEIPSYSDWLPHLSFDELALVIWNNRYFLSLGQASYLFDLVLPNIKEITANEKYIRILYLEAGIISFYTGDTDKALFYFETVTGAHYNDYAGKRALYFTAQVLFQKNDFETAKKYALMLYQKTEGNDKHSLNTLAAAIHHIIRVSISRTVTIEDYQEIQSLLMQKNLPNNMIHTLLFIPYDPKETAENIGRIRSAIDFIIKTAEAIGNELVISSAYHWKGLLLSADNKKNEAFEWYTKSNEIGNSVGSVQNVIKIKNGLAYEKLLDGDYNDAYDLINSMLYRINELTDYTETILTLYNLAKILFFGRNFKLAFELFTKISGMMQLFKIDEFQYFTSGDLYVFFALIQCINHDTLQARFIYDNIISHDDCLSTCAKPLVVLLGALIDIAADNVSESLIKFEKVHHLLLTEFSSLKNHMTFAYLEYAAALEYYGFRKEAAQVYEAGLAFAVENKLSVYMSGDFPSDPVIYRNYSIFFEPLKTNFLHMETLATKEMLVNKLHKRIRDTQFLNKMLDLAARYPVKEEFVHHSALTICEYFICDTIYIAEKERTQWITLTSYSRDGLPLNNLPDCDEVIAKFRGADYYFYDNKTQKIYCNISKFEFTGVAVLALNESEQISPEDINLLRIALSSMQSQLTMFKQNEKLLRLSSTDQLTSLKNRHALEDKIDKDSEMIRRYFRRDKIVFQMSVTFLDLDNFKYYNDKYGHEAGDLMIACFGRLLARQYRRIDFIARFGGDEFLIIMPATPPDGALLAADRLRTALAEEMHFIPQLEKHLNTHLSVPENKLLSFCAGISSNSEQENIDDLEEVINRADKALYYAKYTGKHRNVLWSDIKDCDILKMPVLQADE